MQTTTWTEKRCLAVDIETYSSVDLTKSGVYAYAAAPDFTLLLLAYAFDDEEGQIVDLASGETLPSDVLQALTSPEILKTAYNANFERTCLSAFLNIPMPAEQWNCTMVWAAELGLPRSLKEVAQVLGLEEQKDAKGKALIRYFSTPCNPTEANGGRSRNLPLDDLMRWAEFKEYCLQDVRTERAIRNGLADFPLLPGEQELWILDQQINDRGCRIDTEFVKNAICYNEQFTAECTERFTEITGIDRPTKVAALKDWIGEQLGTVVRSLNKEALKELLHTCADEAVKEALTLRAYMAKTSVSKYQAMLRCVAPDGRIRGFLQFYGANRSGRWAGRLVQVQNLPQNHMRDLDTARELVRDGDYDWFRTLYDAPHQVLSELIRTAFIPEDGKRFIVVDFSAIEARVIAWLSGEVWRMKVFAEGGDIYCASASRMFRVPVEKHGINGHLRQKGKIAELALGYGGSVNALISMGALKMGLSEDELPELVAAWRESNPAIRSFWQKCEKAAFQALKDKPTELAYGVCFFKKNNILFIRLPSGRCLAYVQPEERKSRFDGTAITYMGMSQGENKWARIETWGGKLTENIVQAIARDCLAESIKRLEAAGYEIVFHVHDEVVIEAPEGVGSVEEIAALMCAPLIWAPGLVLQADGYECRYYQKD